MYPLTHPIEAKASHYSTHNIPPLKRASHPDLPCIAIIQGSHHIVPISRHSNHQTSPSLCQSLNSKYKKEKPVSNRCSSDRQNRQKSRRPRLPNSTDTKAFHRSCSSIQVSWYTRYPICLRKFCRRFSSSFSSFCARIRLILLRKR